MNIPNSQQPIQATTFRQTGEDDYRVATIKDQNEGSYLFHCEGLTKREYFAGLAIRGIMANSSHAILQLTDPQKVEYSIIMADELLKQLEKQP